MNSNEFIVKLKADGSPKDWLDLDEVRAKYLDISAKLPTADCGSFAVNVLCTLCRNIDKVQSWASAVDQKSLLMLAIECVRQTRGTDNGCRAKSLACVYHLHRHAIRQTFQKLPPELILKISYMPFENTTENLIKDQYKIYWSLLKDRITYIEKLKSQNMAINKLFTKLSEDIYKVIEIYDTVQFTNTLITFLISKLHTIYSDCHTKELNNFFGKIFQILTSKTDVAQFKKLTETNCMEIYVKLNECLYLIAENNSKMDFKDGVLSNIVRHCITMLGHSAEIYHCLQTFLLNGFCTIFTENSDGNFSENILKNIEISCENTTKLGYTKTLKATYPFLSQFLRLYVDYYATDDKWKNFNMNLQETCLNLIQYLMRNLIDCEQQIRCENCKVKTGLHDALRLSFLTKIFITLSLQTSIDIKNILPIYTTIVLDQYTISQKLCSLGCNSYERFYLKLQTDIHNNAILLYKNSSYEYSIKLFDIYLKNEIKYFKTESDLKNISRALYNKSICELDYQLHENALKDAYLSLIFGHPESLNSDKYMSLVMDIKAKALKYQNSDENDNQITNNDEKSQKNDKNLQKTDKESHNTDKKSQNNEKSNNNDKKHENDFTSDDLQLMTVLDACQNSIDGVYGNLKPFFCNLKFSKLLNHEFEMYTQLWPAVLPIAGVWRSLLYLTKNNVSWLKVKDENLHQTLYHMILQSINHIRTIHNAHLTSILKEIVADLDLSRSRSSAEMKAVFASLLFWKAEYDMQEASEKYGWKVTDANQEDECVANRTLKQEHEATSSALQAVHVWMDLYKCIHTVPQSSLLRASVLHLSHALPWLLRVHKMADALQMAHVCCAAAKIVQDKPSFIRAASIIISHASSSSDVVEDIVKTAKLYSTELLESKNTVDIALVFMVDLSMYYAKIGSIGVSANLLQICQAYILHSLEKYEDVKLDLSTGRLLEAQSLLCVDKQTSMASQSLLTAVNGTHRHYVGISSSASTYSTRRLLMSTVRHLSTAAGITACARAKAALLLRRARAAAASAHVYATATDLAKLSALTANTHCGDDTQVKIDNRLKYILGIPSTDQIYTQNVTSKKEPMFTPKQEIETMLENMTFKKTQLSPSLPNKIPAFKTPPFLTHVNCQCHNCQNPESLTLTCQTIGLEASMYFRGKEFDIAKNYFDGCLKCISFAESKLKSIFKKYRDLYESYICDIVEKVLWDDLRYVQLHILIENAFFELSQRNYKDLDEKIVSIHEILQEFKDADLYIRNEVLNLLVATAKLRKSVEKPQIDNLENEMELLKLSPTAENLEPPKTPEMKPKNPPKITKNVVPDDEVPNMKRRVIKMNLDDDENKESDEKEKHEVGKITTKRHPRIPKLTVTKPDIETMTPIPASFRKKATPLDENTEPNATPYIRKPKLTATKPQVEMMTPVPATEKKKATSLDENNDTNDFATPRPIRRKPKINIEGETLEFVTPKPKRTLTKSKSVTENSVHEKTSVFDFATPKPKTESKRTVKSKSVLERSTSLAEKSVLENSSVQDKSVFDFATPKPKGKGEDFFTPTETPSEFFTPLTSVKTYTKISLRMGLIKNLESEFSTPKIVIDKENLAKTDNGQISETCTEKSRFLQVPDTKSRSRKVEMGSMKSLRDKRSLKRATSPGKLEKEEKMPPKTEGTSIRRLRKPVRFSIDSPDEDTK